MNQQHSALSSHLFFQYLHSPDEPVANGNEAGDIQIGGDSSGLWEIPDVSMFDDDLPAHLVENAPVKTDHQETSTENVANGPNNSVPLREIIDLDFMDLREEDAYVISTDPSADSRDKGATTLTIPSHLREVKYVKELLEVNYLDAEPSSEVIDLDGEVVIDLDPPLPPSKVKEEPSSSRGTRGVELCERPWRPMRAPVIDLSDEDIDVPKNRVREASTRDTSSPPPKCRRLSYRPHATIGGSTHHLSSTAQGRMDPSSSSTSPPRAAKVPWESYLKIEGGVTSTRTRSSVAPSTRPLATPTRPLVYSDWTREPETWDQYRKQHEHTRNQATLWRSKQSRRERETMWIDALTYDLGPDIPRFRRKIAEQHKGGYWDYVEQLTGVKEWQLAQDHSLRRRIFLSKLAVDCKISTVRHEVFDEDRGQVIEADYFPGSFFASCALQRIETLFSQAASLFTTLKHCPEEPYAKMLKSATDKPALPLPDDYWIGMKDIEIDDEDMYIHRSCVMNKADPRKKKGMIQLKIQINFVPLLYQMLDASEVESWDAKWAIRKITGEKYHKQMREKQDQTLTLTPYDDYNLAPCPPNWTKNEKLQLQKWQAQSLSWMLEREENPTHYEASWTRTIGWKGDLQFGAYLRYNKDMILPKKAHGIDLTVDIVYRVRGGILCDEIGAGKTVVTLALMDSNDYSHERHITPDGQHKACIACPATHFPSRATLIVCPTNMIDQWGDEIDKFLSKISNRRVIRIRSCVQLKGSTVRDLQEAFAIIISFAIFSSPVYRQRAAFLSGSRDKSRPFEDANCRRRLRQKTHSLIRNTSEHDWWHTPPNKAFPSEFVQGPEGPVPKFKRKVEDFKFPLLEQFYWYRLVLDEFHEITGMNDVKHHDYRNLVSYFRWGLTGTYNCASKHVSVMTQIFRCEIPPEHYQQFLDLTCRKNNSKPKHVPKEEHTEYVTLDPYERAIYMSKQDQWRSNMDEPGALRSQETAVKFCSHYAYHGNRSAQDETKQIGTQKSNAVRDAMGKVQSLANAARERFDSKFVDDILPNWHEEIIKSTFDIDEILVKHVNLDAEDEVFGNLKKVKTDWHEALKQRKADYDEKKRANTYYQTILSLLQRNARKAMDGLDNSGSGASRAANTGGENTENPECSICLEPFTGFDTALTRCGHPFHGDCINEMMKNNSQCGMCRAPLKKSDVTNVVFEGLTPSSLENSGSKLRRVCEVIMDIIGKDDHMLVFCQWEELKKKIAEVFAKRDIKYCTLKGSPQQRCTIIKNFQAGKTARVMLLSLEDSASGTNLTIANHVLLVHPMVAATTEIGESQEKQALGRVRRMGQKKKVHLWRFITRDTLEEDMEKNRLLHTSVEEEAAEGNATQ